MWAHVDGLALFTHRNSGQIGKVYF